MGAGSSCGMLFECKPIQLQAYRAFPPPRWSTRVAAVVETGLSAFVSNEA